jgi:prevent-host-death family protein
MTAVHQEKTVSFREFRKNLSAYLRDAEHGRAVVVTSRGKEVARLGPPPAIRRPLIELLGLFKDKIEMADDFDETPAEIIEAMESEV